MVKQTKLDLISKMRSDAALYPAFEGEYNGTGRPAKYGEKIHVRQLDSKYLKETSTEDHLRTEIYQGQFYNKEFAFILNVVVVLKTNLKTGAQAHVILFSTNLELAYLRLLAGIADIKPRLKNSFRPLIIANSLSPHTMIIIW